MARYDARQIQKRSTVPGAVPTVAPSNNHLDGTWGVNDIYEGELFINIPDQKIFMRCATTIVDITATIAGITTASNGLTLSGSDVKLGGTLTANTAINGAFNFNIGNVTPITSFNVTSSGTISLTNLSNSQVSLGLNLTLISVGAKVQIISQTNTEISTGGVLRVNIDGSGGITIPQFAGVGDRTLGVDSTGKLKIVAGGGGGISLTDLSAVNGITYNNSTGQFKLGGTLIEDTTIDGNSDTYSFTFGSVNNFNVNAANNVNITANLGTLNLSGFDIFVASLASGIVVSSGTNIIFRTNGGLTRGSWQTSGALRVDNLNGTGDKYIGADVNGDLITMATPQATLVSGTNIKTINGSSVLGSGNLQVGDVLIGGNTVTSNMLIGTNSNFGLQLETNTVVRQTIDNDGLVTFNGTSGGAGIVRMRRLNILDADGVTWKEAFSSSTSNTLTLGFDFSSVSVVAGMTVSGNLTTNANLITNVLRNRTNGTALQVTTLDRNGANTDNIYIKTGDDNSGANLSGSILLDTGTTVGGTRGGVAFFNGNVAPTWNSLQRGIFVGNATAIPTGNPTAGFYMYGNSGVPTFRNTSGNVVKLETRPAVTTMQGIADALTNLGFLASSTITGLSAFSDPITQTLQTTNNTPTTIITVSGLSNAVHNIKCYITGLQNGGSNAIGIEMFFIVKVISGTATIVGTVTRDRKSDFAATITANAVASGSGYLIQVTGQSGVTIDWNAELIETKNA